jgi:hypothetical protein
MNEIEQISYQGDLELLKTIKPDWANAAPQPFLTSPQQNVTQPTWNKLKAPQPTQSSVPQDSFGTITVTGCLNGSPAFARIPSYGPLTVF